MLITLLILAACITYWVISVRNWNARCRAAREQFLKTNH